MVFVYDVEVEANLLIEVATKLVSQEVVGGW